MSRKLIIIMSVLAAMFCVNLDSSTAEAGRWRGGYRAGWRGGYGYRAGWRGGSGPRYYYRGYYGPRAGVYYYH
jgi:hypothetical protein